MVRMLQASMDLFPMEKQKSMDKNSTVKFHGFTERTLIQYGIIKSRISRYDLY